MDGAKKRGPSDHAHSIRCLRAIEQYVGGRKVLSEKLGVSEHTISRWITLGRVSRGQVLPLTKVCQEKFSAEELLGAYDDNDIKV